MVKAIDVGNRRVKHVSVNESCGVMVDGVGWNPTKKDLKSYLAKPVFEKLRKELEDKYKNIPKDAREKLVKNELSKTLANLARREKLKEIFRIHSSPG